MMACSSSPALQGKSGVCPFGVRSQFYQISMNLYFLLVFGSNRLPMFRWYEPQIGRTYRQHLCEETTSNDLSRSQTNPVQPLIQTPEHNRPQWSLHCSLNLD
jgi:hypothetical protein